ncbi:hypothetical protein V1264_007083 [Littorina saxatilis]|uniref:Uncharacterized protein n=1 Tax=Littorina saxatilis TaxID=31220 RepID=A0AAN9G467_9CAEN
MPTVKPDDPSSITPLLIGSIIGGVLSFLVVVILIVLVVVVYRRLQPPDSSRRETQDDEHDYSSLTPAGRYAAPDHSGVELGGLDLDLTNPSLDDQKERPVSDYDVIGDENPEIAKYLAESSLAKEQPDYISLREGKEDYITPCSPPESNEDKKDSDNLMPHSPRPNSDGQEKEDQGDYITPCSPPESSEDKNDSDYLTPCSVKENLGN